MRAMRSDYNNNVAADQQRGRHTVTDNSNGGEAVSGEVPVPNSRVRRGQAAARKHKRDAAKKGRKAAAARKWNEANAL